MRIRIYQCTLAKIFWTDVQQYIRRTSYTWGHFYLYWSRWGGQRHNRGFFLQLIFMMGKVHIVHTWSQNPNLKINYKKKWTNLLDLPHVLGLRGRSHLLIGGVATHLGEVSVRNRALCDITKDWLRELWRTFLIPGEFISLWTNVLLGLPENNTQKNM